jgi:hypothetical protein
MDTFRWLAVVLSTIIGLGITRVLSGFVSAFKLRRRARPDWLPLLIAAVILSEILQFWWALAELLNRPDWTVTDFMLLIALVMQLFLAAALITPSEAEIMEEAGFFERDGRYALLVLAIFHLTAIVTNHRLWGQSALSLGSLPIVALAVICLVAAATKRRKLQEAMAILYLAASVVSIMIESPAGY